jgi:hypothetical protein
MKQDVHVRHAVGRCPVDGVPILDSGYSDDPELWEHSWPAHPELCAPYLLPEEGE